MQHRTHPQAGLPGVATQARFLDDVLRNPHNRALLERMPALHLPDAWLAAGCLFQTVWNLQDGRGAADGIKDYDLFYFDASDLSADAEQAVCDRVADQLGDLGVDIEVKNQARVHTWYRDCFGFDYPALRSAREGIDRFLVPCTAVGLQCAAGDASPLLYAPYGLDDLYRGVLRPNPLCDHRRLFRHKAESYQARWDWLQVREPRTI